MAGHVEVRAVAVSPVVWCVSMLSSALTAPFHLPPVQVVKYLLDNGAAVEDRDHTGMSALDYAATHG
jgi:ankyrin repeat protein